MHFSNILAASLVAPLVAAHGDIPGLPKVFGLPRDLEMEAKAVAARRVLRHPTEERRDMLETRQGGQDGRCGPKFEGASCAAGYCCSGEVCWIVMGTCGTGMLTRCRDTVELQRITVLLLTVCSNMALLVMRTRRPLGLVRAMILVRRRAVLRTVAKASTHARFLAPLLSPTTTGRTTPHLLRCILLTQHSPYLYTSQVLDQFATYGFKATFFITGNNLGKGAIDTTASWSNVIKRMIAEGHQVASHTWSHQDLSVITDAQRYDQMVKNEMAIRNIIGKYPTYMRPPYSSCNAACQTTLKNLGYVVSYFDLVGTYRTDNERDIH
jgi:hypothetical protein